MAIIKRPYQADAIVLKGPAAATSSGDIKDIDVGLVVDDFGNMGFRDNYVTSILNKDYVTLKELYTRVQGIFASLNADGDSQLFFKDDTVSRPYSLAEIVNACAAWRKNRTNGSLWWLGRTEIDHSQCANITRPDDLEGQNVLWSVDRYLAELNSLDQCDTVDPLTFLDYTVDPNTGEPRWWDVQNLEIVLPPSDAYKASILMAKLSYKSYNSPEPIIFRLYDASANVELVRTASINDNSGKILYPIPLTYFGPLPTLKTRSQFQSNSRAFSNASQTNCEEDCGCTNLTCIEGDPYCVTSTGENVETVYGEGSHLIKVQFRVINYHTNHWERVFGAEYPVDGQAGAPEYLTNSTMDALLFDISPDGKYSRKQGTETFTSSTEEEVIFENAYTSTDYSVSLSCSQNINVWYTEKTQFGFKIKAELPFSGQVDWTTIGLGE